MNIGLSIGVGFVSAARGAVASSGPGGAFTEDSMSVPANAKYANFDLVTGLNDGTSEANAWQSWSDVITNVAAGDHVFVKQTASRHDPGSTLAFTPSGSDTQPIILQGYKTTCNDGGDDDTNNYFQNGSVTTSRELLLTGNNVKFLYMDFATKKAWGDAGHDLGGEQALFYRCKFTNANNGAGSMVVKAGTETHFVGCIISGYGTSTYVLFIDRTCTVIGCYIEQLASGNYETVKVSNTFSNCAALISSVVQGPGTGSTNEGVVLFGTQGDDKRLILHNSIVGHSVGINFDDVVTSGIGRNSIIGNTIYDVTTGMDSDEATANTVHGLEFLSNAVGAASSRYSNLGDGPDILHDVTLTADPFTDASGGDYSLNATAGGGAACKDVCEPVDVVGDGTDANTLDIGAVQN